MWLTNVDKLIILPTNCLDKRIGKMKVYSSLKSKLRDKDCKLVRRKGRVYVINKKNPKMKARQG